MLRERERGRQECCVIDAESFVQCEAQLALHEANRRSVLSKSGMGLNACRMHKCSICGSTGNKTRCQTAGPYCPVPKVNRYLSPSPQHSLFTRVVAVHDSGGAKPSTSCHLQLYRRCYCPSTVLCISRDLSLEEKLVGSPCTALGDLST